MKALIACGTRKVLHPNAFSIQTVRDPKVYVGILHAEPDRSAGSGGRAIVPRS
jgi:hypothetical protein